MFSLGEMLFLAILALVVVGPRQLPELARQIGRFINEMKRASSSLTDEFRLSNQLQPKAPPPPNKTETPVKQEPPHGS
jgi:sec-independent protein translocase protein TatB